MHITLLCNAGLAIECDGSVLLVDLPNCDLPPFAWLAQGEWRRILDQMPPYDRVCGIYYSHNHPDHCDTLRLEEYRKRYPEIPVFFPDDRPFKGTAVMGPFVISYERIDHAPMDAPAPPHVVSWIRANGTCIYIAADAKLDPDAHRAFLKGRVADGAFWNAMYLSRPETRLLMKESAVNNWIYHMPDQNPDPYGIWKKCNNNLARYPEDLKMVHILSEYPSEIEL